MATSGIKCDPEVDQAISRMEKKEISGFRLKLNKDKNPDRIVVEPGSEVPYGKKKVLKRIRKGFKDDNVCWGVCKIDFVKKGTETNCPQYYMVSWCSDHAKVNQRMVASSTKESLKKKLDTVITQEIQFNDIEEVTVNTLHQKCGLHKQEIAYADGKAVHGKIGHYEISEDSSSDEDCE